MAWDAYYKDLWKRVARKARREERPLGDIFVDEVEAFAMKAVKELGGWQASGRDCSWASSLARELGILTRLLRADLEMEAREYRLPRDSVERGLRALDMLEREVRRALGECETNH